MLESKVSIKDYNKKVFEKENCARIDSDKTYGFFELRSFNKWDIMGMFGVFTNIDSTLAGKSAATFRLMKIEKDEQE